MKWYKGKWDIVEKLIWYSLRENTKKFYKNWLGFNSNAVSGKGFCVWVSRARLESRTFECLWQMGLVTVASQAYLHNLEAVWDDETAHITSKRQLDMRLKHKQLKKTLKNTFILNIRTFGYIWP